MRLRTGYSPEGHPLWSENVPSSAESTGHGGTLDYGGVRGPSVFVAPTKGTGTSAREQSHIRFQRLRGKAA